LTPYTMSYILRKEEFFMSQIEKLIQRICELPDDVRFDELCKVLTYYQYEMISPAGGSHYKFVKPGHETIVLPKHGSMKKVYVVKVKKIIEEEEDHENGG